MTTPALTPLVCLKCQTPMPAKPDEVAWVCSACGQGHLLDEDLPKGLAPLEIQYAANIPANILGRPFWVAEGRATLHRETYSGNAEREAAQFWSEPHAFFVPAFSCPLDQMISVGVQMLRQPPMTQPGRPTAFAPVTLALDDVRPMAEFIIMGLEAERSDKLKELTFELELPLPALWILP
jgi:hypothetical protein